MKTIVSVCDVCKKRDEYQEDSYATEHQDRSVALWENRKRMATLDVCEECFKLILEASRGVLRGEPVSLYRCNPDGSRAEATPLLIERAPEPLDEPEPAPEPAPAPEPDSEREGEPYSPPVYCEPDSSFTGREGREGRDG